VIDQLPIRPNTCYCLFLILACTAYNIPIKENLGAEVTDIPVPWNECCALVELRYYQLQQY